MADIESDKSIKKFDIEDLLADCGMFVTGLLEIELKTAGYTITDIELDSVTDIENDIPMYRYVFKTETTFAEVNEDVLEVEGETEEKFKIPVYVIDLQQIIIKYPDNINFPDTGLSQVTEHKIGESIEDTDNSNKTDISVIEAFHILEWVDTSHFDLNYIKQARNTRIYTALKAQIQT